MDPQRRHPSAEHRSPPAEAGLDLESVVLHLKERRGRVFSAESPEEKLFRERDD